MGSKPRKQLPALDTETAQLLKRTESNDLEVKRSISAVKAELLVALANSHTGGVILAGVDEAKTAAGGQQLVIFGTQFNDTERLELQNRAEQCRPAVTVEYRTEVLNEKTIVRIEVRSSPDKPHCTSGGTYKIRRDAKNSPLTPSDMLQLFLEREEERFLGRFHDATASLNSEFKQFESRMSEIQDDFSQSDTRLTHLLEMTSTIAADASMTAEQASQFSTDAAESAHEAAEYSSEIHTCVEEMAQSVEHLTRELERVDSRADEFHTSTIVWLREIAAKLGLDGKTVWEEHLRRSLRDSITRVTIMCSAFSKQQQEFEQTLREVLTKVAETHDGVCESRKPVIIHEVLAEPRPDPTD